MEWFFFLVMGAIFFIALYWVKEKYTIFRLFLFAAITLLFGLYMSSGISFPTGSTSTVAGGTTTTTITYTTYTAALSGANSFPILYGLQWGMIIAGILGLVFTLIEVFRFIFTPNEQQIRMV